MKANPEEFIADWIEQNPKGCQALAGAVLYSYFNDISEDAVTRTLSLNKSPDAVDLNNELIDAIRSTDVVSRIEGVVGMEVRNSW